MATLLTEYSKVANFFLLPGVFQTIYRFRQQCARRTEVNPQILFTIRHIMTAVLNHHAGLPGIIQCQFCRCASGGADIHPGEVRGFRLHHLPVREMLCNGLCQIIRIASQVAVQLIQPVSAAVVSLNNAPYPEQIR